MNPLDIVLQVLGNLNEVESTVNAACANHRLPAALNGVNINADYRFDGFGIAFQGFRPQVTFWVHYKPGSPQDVSLGKFEIPVSYPQALTLVADLAHPSRSIS